jgi:hypothetical protein
MYKKTAPKSPANGMTSKYRGVSWNTRSSKWRASIRHTGKSHHLGYFDNEEEAAEAYDRAARAHRGDRAMLTFPAEGERGVGDGKRSKYRGVHWYKSSSKWVAQIYQAGKQRSLGYFYDEEEAARAYDRAAMEHHGDKAMLNFWAEADDEQRRQQEQAAAAPAEVHSWSGMYPSVIVALGFRLQVHIPQGAGAEPVEKSAGGGSSRGGRGPKLYVWPAWLPLSGEAFVDS